MFSFDPVTDDTAKVNIRWEKICVPFEVKVDVVATTLAHARTAVAAAKADDWRTRLNTGAFAMQNKDAADGTVWLGQALTIVDASIAVKETYQNLTGRFSILFALGRKDDALAAADKAIAFGKANKADTSGLEKRVADIRAGKM